MIKLGPFTVRRDGELSIRSPASPPTMRFAWRGLDCEARLEPAGLRLHAVAGRIPSTAERGADRRRTFAALAQLRGEMPAGWRLRLLPDHRLTVEAEWAPHCSAATLVSAMVRFALALDPYLDTLEAAGAGRLNT